jgi:hypothetical protein
MFEVEKKSQASTSVGHVKRSALKPNYTTRVNNTADIRHTLPLHVPVDDREDGGAMGIWLVDMGRATNQDPTAFALAACNKFQWFV